MMGLALWIFGTMNLDMFLTNSAHVEKLEMGREMSESRHSFTLPH